MLLTEVSCLDEIGLVFDTDIGILPELMKLSAASSFKWLEEDEFYETFKCMLAKFLRFLN